MTTAPTREPMSFSIDGPGFTMELRDLWRDGRRVFAYQLAKDALHGIDDDTVFAILGGRKRLDNVTGQTLEAVDDDWTPGYAAPSMAVLLDQAKLWEKWQPHIHVIEQLRPLVFAASGGYIAKGIGRRGRQGPGSPTGYVTADMVTHLLSQMLDEPTDDEWEDFWKKHAPALRQFLQEKYADRPALLSAVLPKLKKVQRGTMPPEDFFALHNAATTNPERYVALQAEMEGWSTPKPDPAMKGKAGYVLPDGTFYPCIYMGHNWLAFRLAKKLGTDSRDAAKAAEQEWGWVRLSTMADGQRYIGWYAKQKPTKKQKDAVQLWAAVHKVDLTEDFQ